MTSEHFDVFGITVGIAGDNPVADSLREEYADMRPVSEPADLRIEVIPGFVAPPTSGRTIENVHVTDAELFIDERTPVPIRGIKDAIHNYVGTLGRQIRVEATDERVDVTLRYDPRITTCNAAARKVFQLVDRSYVTRPQNLAKVLLYNDIEPLVHHQLVEQRSAFIHASGLSDDAAVLFAGWGGAGKTSAVMELLDSSNDEFVADDLCLVNADGEAYPYLKPVQMYAYNTTDETAERILSGRSLFDRGNWVVRKAVLGEKRVRRRISPRDLYPRRTATESIPISSLLYLRREHRGDIDHRPASADEIAEMATAALLEEFDAQVQRLPAITAADPTRWPSVQSLAADTAAIYRDAFAEADRYLVRVPTDAVPRDLAEYLSRRVLH